MRKYWVWEKTKEKEWNSEETWKERERRKLAEENVKRRITRQQKISTQTI